MAELGKVRMSQWARKDADFNFVAQNARAPHIAIVERNGCISR